MGISATFTGVQPDVVEKWVQGLTDFANRVQAYVHDDPHLSPFRACRDSDNVFVVTAQRRSSEETAVTITFQWLPDGTLLVEPHCAPGGLMSERDVVDSLIAYLTQVERSEPHGDPPHVVHPTILICKNSGAPPLKSTIWLESVMRDMTNPDAFEHLFGEWTLRYPKKNECNEQQLKDRFKKTAKRILMKILDERAGGNLKAN